MSERRIRFNWFDVLFIVLTAGVVLLILWTFVWRNTSQVPENSQPVTLRYVVKVSGLREELEDRVRSGEQAYEVSGMYELGTVIGAQSDATSWFSTAVTTTAVDENGKEYETPVRSPMPGKADLYVTFEADAYLESDGRYYVDGYVICTGTYLKIMTQHFWCEGYCVSVSEAG